MKQIKTIYAHISGRSMLIVLTVVMWLGIFITAFNQEALADNETFHLADKPLEVRGYAAPPVMNIAWDASGSMLWSIFTEDDRYIPYPDEHWHEYGWVFPESNYYYNSLGTYRVLPFSARNHWQTQCYAYNHMYYHPEVEYTPWPRWTDLDPEEYNIDFSNLDFNADIDNPRQHPMKDDYGTFNLSRTFFNFDIQGAGAGSEKVIIPSRDIVLDGNWAQIEPDKDENYFDYYVDDYYYTRHAANRSATWSTDDLDPNQTYNVYVHIPAYRIEYDNQPLDHHEWAEYKVSPDGGDEYTGLTIDISAEWQILKADDTPLEVQFPTGQGTVELDVQVNQRHLASAVAFLPTGDNAETIVFPHYFIEKDKNEVYLVNMDGEISYYEVVLDDNDYRIVDRLIPISVDEAESAGLVTGRSYTDERQNFANWYQFYRKRYFTGIAAAANFIDGWSNAFIRFRSFPKSYDNITHMYRQVSAIDMYVDYLNTGDNEHYCEKDDFLYELYTMHHPWGNTPLPDAMYEAGEFFEFGTGWNDLHGQSPYREYSNTHLLPFFKPEYGGECQHSFNIVMTDGMWNVPLRSNDSVGNVDRDGYIDSNQDPDFPVFYGGVFADDYSDTAADIAMHFYARDLKRERTGASERNLQNFVPPAPFEDPEATHQRMITYGISYGVPGYYTEEQRQRFTESLRYGNEPEDDDWEGWQEPEVIEEDSLGVPANLDDLWHATINSRGEFFSASRPDELIASMEKIKDDIMQRIGTGAAVSTSTVERRTDTMVFKGEYNSTRWSGDLIGVELMGDQESWSAAEILDAMEDLSDRNIFTATGAFGLNSVDALTEEDQVKYLRGDRSLEFQNGGNYRNRDSRLGDIINSEPAYHNGVVYVGANDGMLHAFDAKTGKELFAYIPSMVHENLHKLTDPEYSYQYFVNGSPTVRKIGDKRVLVGGLRQGGKGYFALDVTDPDNMSHDNVLWEFTAEDDPDLGYSFSRPIIRETNAGWVVLFGNGYNSANGDAILFAIDINTGDVVEKIVTDTGGSNGIVGAVAAIDPDFDGYIDFVYAGDLKGNLWKFDLQASNDWGVAYNKSCPYDNNCPLFTARNAAGDVQPITSQPDVMFHCQYPGYLVVFGTGKLVSELDFGNTQAQNVYGIWDWEKAWDQIDGETGNDKAFGTFLFDRTLSNMTSDLSDLTLLYQEVTGELTHTDGNDYLIVSGNEINWYDPRAGKPEDGVESHVGWYFQLPDDGERVTIAPQIRGENVHIVGTTPTDEPCMAGGRSNRYALNACTGGAPSSPQFFDEDGKPIEGVGGKRYDEIIPGFTILEPGEVIIPITNGGDGDDGDDGDDDFTIEQLERYRSGVMYWHEW